MVLCAALILLIIIHGAALTDSMYNSSHVSFILIFLHNFL